jgi:deoxycytidine triphosphate deaminase
MLNGDQIRTSITRGSMLVHPYKPDNVGPNSLDLCLGENFFRERRVRRGQRPRFCNIYNGESLDGLWEPVFPKTVKKWREKLKDKLTGLHPDERMVVLQPGESLLGHSEEFVGGEFSAEITLVGEMHGRSTIGRCLIKICADADLGDLGFYGRWTFMLTNHMRHHALNLVVGRRIAQLTFHEVRPLRNQAHAYPDKGGTYRVAGKTPEEIRQDWRPQMILPKAGKSSQAPGGIVELPFTRIEPARKAA